MLYGDIVYYVVDSKYATHFSIPSPLPQKGLINEFANDFF